MMADEYFARSILVSLVFGHAIVVLGTETIKIDITLAAEFAFDLAPIVVILPLLLTHENMKNFVTLSEFSEVISVTNGPLLGIDWGLKKIGLSISDASREFIFPLSIIKNESLDDAVAKIMKIVCDRKVAGIVIGNPLNLDGADNPRDKKIQTFADRLIQASGRPILFQDERFTSKLVHVSRHHISDKRRTKDDDSASACYILQTTLAVLNQS